MGGWANVTMVNNFDYETSPASFDDSRVSGQSTSRTRPSKRRLQVPDHFEPIASGTSSISKLNAKDLQSDEIWAFRLPIGIKPKHLVNLKLDLSTFNSRKTAETPSKVGELQVNDVRYDVLAELTPTDLNLGGLHSRQHASSSETNETSQLSALIPDQKNNPQEAHLVIAPKPISRVIFFRRQHSEVVMSTTSLSASIISRKPDLITSTSKRAQVPQLESRNIPYGANTKGFEYDNPCNTAPPMPPPKKPTSPKKKLNKRLKT